jgi:hypothetical protein
MATYRKYTKELLQEAVENSSSYAGILRYLNLRQAGGTQAHIINKVKEYQLDTTHFTGQAHNRDKSTWNRKAADDVLICYPDDSRRVHGYLLRRSMLEKGLEEKCNHCGLSGTWNNKPIKLEINHIDGNWLNCTINNVEFICPNCHSQQAETNMPHKYRNK